MLRCVIKIGWDDSSVRVYVCHDVQGEPAAYYEMKVVSSVLLVNAPTVLLSCIHCK